MKNNRQKIQPEDSDSSENQPIVNGSKNNELSYPKIKVRIGLGLAIVGYLLFLLGARPSIFGLDRSRVIGFVQISVFLIGLGIITVGSYLTLNAVWPEGKKTIAADIGTRLISTGYVICVFTGMADIFGLGSHPLPDVFFGPLQAKGVGIGMATIAAGFLLLIRYRRPEDDHHLANKSEKESERNSQSPRKEISSPTGRHNRSE
jgi:hypothetical protein